MSNVAVVKFDEVDEEVMTRWDITGHQRNRHLLSWSLTGTPDVVGDFITFPPGFVHHMHSHPHADLILVPLNGSVQFLGVPGPAVEVRAGQMLVIPRENWHEVSNTGTSDCQVLHFFTGVGSIDDIGYEAYADAEN